MIDATRSPFLAAGPRRCSAGLVRRCTWTRGTADGKRVHAAKARGSLSPLPSTMEATAGAAEADVSEIQISTYFLLNSCF